MEDQTVPTRVDSPHNELPPVPELRPDDIIVAVMGITGCGKTTFVNLFTEYQLPVGHMLDSCTETVQVVPCTLDNGVNFYLVDTPGFDDTRRSDSEILQEVALWLNKAHSSNLKLAGIILLQRISDVRVGGSGMKNIRMFQKLCGDDTLAGVVLATTMWDMTPEQTALQREQNLKEQPQLWKRMMDHGSQVFRHDEGRVSALKIIEYFIARKQPVTLDIQREMEDQQVELLDTGAGSELASAVEKLTREYEKRLKELEEQLIEARNNSRKEEQEILEAMKKENEERLLKQQYEMATLRVSVAQMIEKAKNETEELKKINHDHTKELERQKTIVRRQVRARYLQEMSDRVCAVM